MQSLVIVEEAAEVQALRQLVLEQLTEKQRLILFRAPLAERQRISKFVTALRKELQCSDSILWKGIRFLREKQLLARSESLVLTPAGRLLVGEITIEN